MLAKTFVIVCLHGLSTGLFTGASEVRSSIANQYYLKIPVGRYTFVNNKRVTFHEAHLACEKECKKLLDIEDETEWKQIEHIITELGLQVDLQDTLNLFWTGGNSMPLNQSYTWGNGKPLPDNAAYWGSGEPSRTNGKQQCVSIGVFDKEIVKLNDWYCDRHAIGYICEIADDPEVKLGVDDRMVFPNETGKSREDISRGDFTFVMDPPSDYNGAKQVCKSKRLGLVNIQTESKWKMIQALMKESGLDKEKPKGPWYWTAGTSMPENKTFRWTDGEVLYPNASYWGPNQPDDPKGNEHCASISGFEGGQSALQKSDCGAKLEILCEVRKTSVDGSFTIVTGKPLSYSEAKQHCTDDGQELVNVQTESKWQMIKMEILRNGLLDEPKATKHAFWTAGTSLPEKKNYTWAHGEPLPDNTSFWAHDEPNRFQGKEHCVSIAEQQELDFALADVQCDTICEYICEPIQPQDDVKKITIGDYSIVTGKQLGYFEARGACIEDHKNLVNIETETKWKEIEKMITTLEHVDIANKTPKQLYWTAGFLREVSEKEAFRWRNDEEFPKNASYWGPSLPSPEPGRDCISIEKFDGGILGLNNRLCYDKIDGYLCEPKVPKPPTSTDDTAGDTNGDTNDSVNSVMPQLDDLEGNENMLAYNMFIGNNVVIQCCG